MSSVHTLRCLQCGKSGISWRCGISGQAALPLCDDCCARSYGSTPRPGTALPGVQCPAPGQPHTSLSHINLMPSAQQGSDLQLVGTKRKRATDATPAHDGQRLACHPGLTLPQQAFATAFAFPLGFCQQLAAAAAAAPPPMLPPAAAHASSNAVTNTNTFSGSTGRASSPTALNTRSSVTSAPARIMQKQDAPQIASTLTRGAATPDQPPCAVAPARQVQSVLLPVSWLMQPGNLNALLQLQPAATSCHRATDQAAVATQAERAGLHQPPTQHSVPLTALLPLLSKLAPSSVQSAMKAAAMVGSTAAIPHGEAASHGVGAGGAVGMGTGAEKVVAGPVSATRGTSGVACSVAAALGSQVQVASSTWAHGSDNSGGSVLTAARVGSGPSEAASTPVSAAPAVGRPPQPTRRPRKQARPVPCC